MTQTKYNPEDFLETTIRGLKDFVLAELKKTAVDDNNNYVGDQLYDVVMEFPSTDLIVSTIPMAKTIIHFEIDNLADQVIGFGDNVFKENYDALLQQVTPQAAAEHRLNFDVGIWTSDRAGGITSRLRAYQALRNVLQGPLAFQKLKDATVTYDSNGDYDGALEILDFSGGRFITEQINDVNVYRVIDCQLVIRVYSRTPLDLVQPTIEEIIQDPDLIIDQDLHL